MLERTKVEPKLDLHTGSGSETLLKGVRFIKPPLSNSDQLTEEAWNLWIPEQISLMKNLVEMHEKP